MTPTVDNNKVKLVIFGIVLLLATVLILAVVSFSSREDTVSIDNYDAYTKDLPSSQRISIDESLYQAVKLNLVDGEKMIRSTALIRDKSTHSSYSEDRNVHTGSFIVDLKEIRQSYLVSYDWSDDTSNPNTSGYPTQVRCLSDDDTKNYKDFDCKDGSEESGLPLEYQLPYADINGPFEAVFMYKQGGNTVIGIDNSTPNGRQKAIKWLKSKNIDPSGIIIYYLDMNDQLRRFRYGTE